MRRIGGILAGLCLAGGLALANEGTVGSKSKQEGQQTTGQQQSGQTGSAVGGAGMTTGQEGQQQLEGTVVKAGRRQLFIEHMGAVVELKLDNKTRFEGATIRQAKDLKEGERVQVSFEVQNETQNVAKVISPASDLGTGGGGFEGEPGTGMEQDDTPTEPKDRSNPSQGEDKPLY